MKQTTSNSYKKRLIKVIDYIHANLEHDLDINTLANIACMSPYHFHRIYRELSHETVNNTVRRLRLQRAAVELIRSKQPISHIARLVSYKSIEAFSRAFTKQFGETPSDYRNNKQAPSNINYEPFIAMLQTTTKVYDIMYNVEILQLPKIDIISYDHKGDYMEIGAVFEKLFIYASTHNLLNQQTRSLGLYYDDPKSVGVADLRSKAAIVVNTEINPADNDAPAAMSIPAGKYASIVFKGAYPELEKPYDWLFGEWLPNSGHEAADFPPIEEYLNDPKETPPNELLTRIHFLLA